MKSTRTLLAICTVALTCTEPAYANDATGLTAKMQPYIKCLNSISGRAFQSRDRYLSWVGKSGPTNMDRATYGVYTISSTDDCAKGVAKANAQEPHDTPLEQAGDSYVSAATALEPLLKTADDYYSQGNFKDDKLAKGKQMHAGLMAGFANFEAADRAMRAKVEELTDFLEVEELATIEKEEGRKLRYLRLALMHTAKRLVNVETATEQSKLDIKAITAALAPYETIVTELDAYTTAHKDERFNSSLLSSAKSFLTSAKELMRRVRDKTPYSQGERMILNTGQGAWMVDGSPARVSKDFNALVSMYNMRL